MKTAPVLGLGQHQTHQSKCELSSGWLKEKCNPLYRTISSCTVCERLIIVFISCTFYTVYFLTLLLKKMIVNHKKIKSPTSATHIYISLTFFSLSIERHATAKAGVSKQFFLKSLPSNEKFTCSFHTLEPDLWKNIATLVKCRSSRNRSGRGRF